MPPRNPKKYLYDIIDCSEFVLQLTKDKTVDDYRTDRVFRSALERELQIIGEAMLQLDHVSPQTVEKISEHRSIIGFRHILVHGYDSLDPDTVWNVIETKIGVLLKQARELLSQMRD